MDDQISKAWDILDDPPEDAFVAFAAGYRACAADMAAKVAALEGKLAFMKGGQEWADWNMAQMVGPDDDIIQEATDGPSE